MKRLHAMKKITCEACGEKTKAMTPWNVDYSVSVNDPETGMQQGLTWSELLECCEVCVEEHPNGAEPYRGRFWRPHLMEAYNRNRQACGFSKVVPA